MFACLECGRKFKTAGAAERAANNGCPKCGGVDIDLDPNPPKRPLLPSVPFVPRSDSLHPEGL